MNRTIRAIAVTLCCGLLLSGCAVRFVYNQLDWLIPWYLEDYIELEGAQETFFKQRLESYLAWHRREQLPQYADFLDQVAIKAERGMSEAEITAIRVQTEQFAQALVNQLKPDMLQLFAMASDEQVEKLFEKFQEDNEKYHREYVNQSEQELRQQRAKEAQRYVERWTGSLNHKQRRLIEEWSASFELMDADIEATQLAWQQEFRRILALRPDKPAYEKAFVALLDAPEFGRSPAFQEKLDRSEQALIHLYRRLDKSLTPQQRTAMVKKLRSYANDFRVLSKQPG